MTRTPERTAEQLLTDFGAPPARRPIPQPPRRRRERSRQRVNRPIAPRRGRARPGLGWAPVEAPLAVYQAATSEIGGLFPLLASNHVPAVGARIGYDVHSGGAFYAHPVEWVLRSMCANPNMVIFGEPGRGKSSTVVAFLLRMMLFGVRTLVSGDVKGEYSPLMRALGITPIALGRGSAARLNALDLGPLAARWDSWSADQQREELDGVLGRWVKLLTALAEAQGYAPTVTDEAVLSQVLRRLVGVDAAGTRLRPVTIPDVQRELADPSPQLWADTRFADRRQFLDTLRPITDALANLISGPLAGLFDEPTNFELDWSAPIQSMDLSLLRSRGDQAVAVALTCLGSWSSMITDLQDDGEIRVVVRDEVWRQMRLGPKAVQAVDSDLRLSRAEKKIQILVGHKPSDFLSVGSAGSQEVAIAKDLLALCSTRILFGQSTRVGGELSADFALSEKEGQVTTGWCMERPGRALWKIENNSGLKIQTVLSPTELRTFDTNAQLRARTEPGRPS
ncbi:ATP-binding protein [Saccharopolyspora indica]|uniref:ATP-binding protein n=1 Tax=Saccharopolyspora indica TaxID=1229659 RepID=UPI0022EB6F83|nr:ATP-binding protein [Saccharopolyspora indica]MDA3644396.1 ATP-binding protein [Saccharopolyspora indica]